MKQEFYFLKINMLVVCLTLLGAYNASAATQINSQTGKQKLQDNEVETIKDLANKELFKVESSQTNGSMVSLKLKDQYVEPYVREYDYFLRLKVQSYHPSGIVDVPIIGMQDLSNHPSSLMPLIELGSIHKLDETPSYQMKWGLQTNFGYASHSRSFTTNTNYTIDSLKLNTSILNIGTSLYIIPKQLNMISFYISPQIGVLNYTQNGSDGNGQFNQYAIVNSIGFGLDAEINSKWAFSTQWAHRAIANQSNQQLDIQRSNFDLGLRSTW